MVATIARYWITFFVFSVLPAPDSPLQGERKRRRRGREEGGGRGRKEGGRRRRRKEGEEEVEREYIDYITYCARRKIIESGTL